jgi:hypothetical protein
VHLLSNVTHTHTPYLSHIPIFFYLFLFLYITSLSLSRTAEAIKKATDLFKQKQYEQHHHRVHVVVPHTQFEESTRYLDGLTKFASIGEVEQQQHKEQHAVVGTSKGYLDTLSEGEVMRKSTWEVYKGLVEKVVKEVKHQNEIDCELELFVFFE